jgi:hypothetical protein
VKYNCEGGYARPIQPSNIDEYVSLPSIVDGNSGALTSFVQLLNVLLKQDCGNAVELIFKFSALTKCVSPLNNWANVNVPFPLSSVSSALLPLTYELISPPIS